MKKGTFLSFLVMRKHPRRSKTILGRTHIFFSLTNLKEIITQKTVGIHPLQIILKITKLDFSKNHYISLLPLFSNKLSLCSI